MPKKQVIFFIGLIVCVAFLTAGWDWNFDDKDTKATTTETIATPTEGGACGESVSYEGQDYATVQIGSQCWMAKNLNVGTQVNGSSDMLDDDIVQKYCYENKETNCTENGGLYQWAEAMKLSQEEGAQGICPAGWHVPSDSDWYTLEKYLSSGTCDRNRLDYGCDPAGKALLSGESSGFGGIYGGYRDLDGSFKTIQSESDFWSSTTVQTVQVGRSISRGDSKIRRMSEVPDYGFSVRCVQN